MMSQMPGVQNGQTATPRKVLVTDRNIAYVPGGVVIDGTKSRDPLNTDRVDVLRAGLLMGKITTSGKYAPSILGVTVAAYDHTDETGDPDARNILEVSSATAAEVLRRIGVGGNLKLTGPPTAGGTVATQTLDVASVDVDEGEIVLDAPGSASCVTGSLIQPADGSETPRCIIGDSRDAYGIRVTDENAASIASVPFPQPIVGGFIDAAQIVNYPADAALKAWVKAQLNTLGGFKFTDNY